MFMDRKKWVSATHVEKAKNMISEFLFTLPIMYGVYYGVKNGIGLATGNGFYTLEELASSEMPLGLTIGSTLYSVGSNIRYARKMRKNKTQFE